ncbi:hypothetical protein RJ639_007632 [Escallonia herrerae]|uniref:Integrase catalytic domain-containing protein n=1 Tax=Escallonia herrerae TaxID=1293975 RepID=A0AA88VUV8_9ASTE|nr:hypothetical protein RJ639_007632 [Escallonia herrerae]
MDILGPFPMATGQRCFVIVDIDYFTKWTEAEPLATITASKCKEFFWKNVVCRFGVPKVLITDNGKQFDNSNFRSFCEGLSIDLRFTSVAHPQSNGQTENMNCSILQWLKRKLDDAKGAWVDELPKARVFGHRQLLGLLKAFLENRKPIFGLLLQPLLASIAIKELLNSLVPHFSLLKPQFLTHLFYSTKFGKQIHILLFKVLDFLIKLISFAYSHPLLSFSGANHVHHHVEYVLHLTTIAIRLEREEK